MRIFSVLLTTVTAASCALDTSPSGVPIEAPAEAPPAVTAPPVTTEPPAPSPIEQPTLATCAPSLAWWREIPSWTVTPATMGVSPNGGLLLRSSQWDNQASVFLRLADGEPVVGAPFLPGASLDAGWHLRVDMEGEETVRVSTVVTGAVLRTFAPQPLAEGWYRQLSPAITLDGERVVALECATAPKGDEHAASLTSWRTDNGQPGYTFHFGMECGWWPSGPGVIPIPGGHRVLVTSPTNGDLVLADLDNGVSWTATLAVDESVEQPFYYGGAIVNAMPSPDGQRVALVTRDAMLHILSLPSLAPALDATPAGVVGINLNTYMPMTAAPLAWSPDGTLLAHVDAEGRVVMRRVADPGLLMTFEAPGLTLEGADEGWVKNAPVSVTFLPDQSGIAISYEQGVALWRCDDAAWPEGEGSLSVLLDGPKSLKAGEAGTWTATHLGTDDVHSHAFFVDGAPVTAPALDRHGAWTPVEPGSYTVSVVIDDGLSTGTASMALTVTP